MLFGIFYDLNRVISNLNYLLYQLKSSHWNQIKFPVDFKNWTCRSLWISCYVISRINKAIYPRTPSILSSVWCIWQIFDKFIVVIIWFMASIIYFYGMYFRAAKWIIDLLLIPNSRTEVLFLFVPINILEDCVVYLSIENILFTQDVPFSI